MLQCFYLDAAGWLGSGQTAISCWWSDSKLSQHPDVPVLGCCLMALLCCFGLRVEFRTVAANGPILQFSPVFAGLL